MLTFVKKQERQHINNLQKEGKHVFETPNKKDIKTAFIIALITLSFLVPCLVPKVTASPATSITSIYRNDGYVGDAVKLNGTIETINGTYRILFDGEIVKNGTASSLKYVNATFLVPHRYKGSHAVTLYDVNASTTSLPALFTISTKYLINPILPPQQTQLMEGQSITIRLNVTGGETGKPVKANATVKLPNPVNTIYYNSSIVLNSTARTGEYMAETVYPRDFGSGANTNYVGIYTMSFYANTSVPFPLQAVASLKVGLTNATQNNRFDNVIIRGSNYVQLDERAWINITLSGKTVFSTNVQAVEEIVTSNWEIPWNATYGTYNVTITSSSSPGTVKTIRDTDTFTIAKATFQCQIHTKNLENENVKGVTVGAYNKTVAVAYATSNASGIATFSLETYTYSFKALMKGSQGVQVGSISALNITGNISTIIVCQLVNIRMAIKDESGVPLPFISVDLKYNYTKITSVTLPETRTLETGSTGIINFQNTFVNTRYVIEAKRNDNSFSRTIIANLTTSQWVNLTCPTYTLYLTVVDSKQNQMPNISLNVTEWTSEILIEDKTWTTDNIGSVSINATFGRYQIKAYKYNSEVDRLVILNETIIDLTENMQYEKIYCKIANLTSSIVVVDYFGKPISNAEVKIERFSETEQRWIELTPSQITSSSVVVSLPSIGGDYSISIKVSGQLSAIKAVQVSKPATIDVKIDRYIAIGGFIVETAQLAVYIALILMAITLVILLTYKKILLKVTKK